MLSQLQVFLIAANFELDRITSHKHGVAAKTVSKWRPRSRSFKTNFFFIAGTLEAETSVSGKAEYLLALGGRQMVNFLD